MTTITAGLNFMRDTPLGPIAKSVESNVVIAQAQASIDRARYLRGGLFNETVNSTQDGPGSEICQIAIHLPFVRI